MRDYLIYLLVVAAFIGVFGSIDYCGKFIEQKDCNKSLTGDNGKPIWCR